MFKFFFTFFKGCIFFVNRDRKGKKIKSVLQSAKKIANKRYCSHWIGKTSPKKVNYLRKGNARRRNIRRIWRIIDQNLFSFNYVEDNSHGRNYWLIDWRALLKSRRLGEKNWLNFLSKEDFLKASFQSTCVKCVC